MKLSFDSSLVMPIASIISRTFLRPNASAPGLGLITFRLENIVLLMCVGPVIVKHIARYFPVPALVARSSQLLIAEVYQPSGSGSKERSSSMGRSSRCKDSSKKDIVLLRCDSE